MVDDHDCRKTTVAASVGDHVDGVSSSARGGGSGSTTLSVDPISMLNGLLTGLQEGTMLPPSEADVQAALDLCDKLSAHLRGLLPSQKAIGESTSSMTEPLMMTSSTVVGGSSTCATSESDSDAPMHSSKCRPSAKARARLRRQRQEQQHEQQHEQYEQHEQHEQQVADQGNADQQPQWQEWQWQWQDRRLTRLPTRWPTWRSSRSSSVHRCGAADGSWCLLRPCRSCRSRHSRWLRCTRPRGRVRSTSSTSTSTSSRKLRKGRAKEPAPPRLRPNQRDQLPAANVERWMADGPQERAACARSRRRGERPTVTVGRTRRRPMRGKEMVEQVGERQVVVVVVVVVMVVVARRHEQATAMPHTEACR